MVSITFFHYILCGLFAIAQPIHALIGGSDAPDNAAPFAVGIYVAGWTGPQLLCTGSKVGVRTVITTAECIYGRTPSEFTIHAGSQEGPKGSKYTLSKMDQHADFNPETGANNYALLYLASHVGGFSINIPSASIADRPAAPGENLTLFGYGKTYQLAVESPKNLQQLSTTALAAAKCNDQWSAINPITTDETCDQPAEGGMACSGDTGGPVVNKDGNLVAMMTNRNRCSNPGLPNVDVDLTSANWLFERIE